MTLFFFIMCPFSDRLQHSCFRTLCQNPLDLNAYDGYADFFFSCWFKLKCSVHGSVLKGILKWGRMQYYKNVAAVLCGTSAVPSPQATSYFAKHCSVVLSLLILGLLCLQDGFLQLK